MRKPKTSQVSKVCLACGKDFVVFPYRADIQKYCDVSCRRTGYKNKPLIPVGTRFWDNVYREHEWHKDQCWGWRGYTANGGYGVLSSKRSGKQKPIRATRISWELHRKGPIPEGMQICHTCDNPPCCNPDHLFLGTAKQNMEDCRRKGRHSTPPIRLRLSDQDVTNIRNIFSRMPFGQRSIFFREAALELGVSAGTVKSIAYNMSRTVPLETMGRALVQIPE